MKTPAKTTDSPSNTRGLKKADREADFFFMEFANDVDGFWVWSVVCSGTATNVSTLFRG
jgi:hypothetical protein